MTIKRIFAGALVLVFAALALLDAARPSTCRAAPASRASSWLIAEAEDQMVGNGYLNSLQGAYWAYFKGPRIIPVLSVMLTKQKYYNQKYDFATGGFPLNALWALGHFKTVKARDALRHYYAWSHDSEALSALKGWELRRKYGFGAGVLINDQILYQRPSEKSHVIAHLPADEPVRILKADYENDREMDARGGPTVYDFIQVLRTGERGYIERTSDDFFPLY